MASGGYDGSIRIKVDADTDRAVTKIQNLEAKLRRQTEAMDRQANRVSDLKAKYDKLASGDVTPRSLVALERKLRGCGPRGEDVGTRHAAGIFVRHGGRGACAGAGA